MSLPVGVRATRLLATRPHHKREPWTSNLMTTALLAYALGLTDTPPADASVQSAYKPGHPHRSAFATEARYTPLGLARVLALRRAGRDAEADALLNGAPEPVTPALPPEPAGTPAPDAAPDGDAEVIHQDEPVLEPDASAGTILPADFPERERLREHGLTTLEAVESRTDAQLRALPGIGASRVSLIRAAVTVARQ